jgi:tRNA pseudouridine38-40 synthase
MPEQVRRIALCIQYEGSAYCGWQRQSRQTSVQGTLEAAIAALAPGHPVKVVAAGRTDSGVHASGQVVHVDVTGPIPAERWSAALNGRLPPTVRVLAARQVSFDWHARFHATYRRYRYTIHNARTPNLFLSRWSWHRYHRRLEERLMEQALREMLGHHDFGAFERAGSRRPHSRTTLQEVLVQREGDLIRIELQASGFLYGMVRLVVGQLVAVGERRLSLDTFEDRWRMRRRHEIKDGAPPQGLCLLRVGYPEPVFPEHVWYDGQPRYQMVLPDPPPEPTSPQAFRSGSLQGLNAAGGERTSDSVSLRQEATPSTTAPS